MRFALLGQHPDGLEVAVAMVEAGHPLIATTTRLPEPYARRLGLEAKPVADLEEVLANPAVQGVIVAGAAPNRAVQLRRSLQAERHVFCVHPADQTPDTGHEAALIRTDTGVVLLPILVEADHPAITRLIDLLGAEDGLGALRFVELVIHAKGPALLDATIPGHHPGLPGWLVLRRIGGEIAEVSGFAFAEEVSGDDVLQVAGRFENAGVFGMTFIPGQREDLWRLTVRGERETAELTFPLGRPGPAFLRWGNREEAWDVTDPWAEVVRTFEAALAGKPTAVTWQDAVRALELDDAVRRAVSRRRAVTMEYVEANEEVGFKGTMTLLGCGMFWVIILLLIAAVWVPWALWLIGPALVVFLVMQLLLWVARRG